MWKRRTEDNPSASSAATPPGADSDPLQTLLSGLNPASEQYAVQLVDRILQLATQLNASDVHFDAVTDGILLRLRVDGRLREIGRLPQGKEVSIAARLKSLAGLLTYRQDIPQEGRMTFGTPRREARVVTFPTLHGERTVLRLVASHTNHWHLADLGLTSEQLARYEAALSQLSGVVLITGAVGMGKTTTAYAALRWLSQHWRRCVVTLEDPIECELPGIAQSQIDPHVGFDWQSGLKSLLRQDPEVMFISEIRDATTAQLAFRASMSGQLVVTTMHARSVGEAWMRLLDMQVPSQHLVFGLKLLACQQLEPQACPCQHGCDQCNYTGQLGRRLQTELLPALEGEFARRALNCASVVELTEDGKTPDSV